MVSLKLGRVAGSKLGSGGRGSDHGPQFRLKVSGSFKGATGLQGLGFRGLGLEGLQLTVWGLGSTFSGLGLGFGIWGFPTIRGTLFWGPYNKDPTISGIRLGSPIFGNSHMDSGFGGLGFEGFGLGA